jgi:hypothetical protein
MGEGCPALRVGGRADSIVHGRCGEASPPRDKDYFLRLCLRWIRHGTNPIRFVAVRRVLWRE